MEIKLKPCPFCGGQASKTSIHKWYFPHYDYVVVVCDSCGAMIHNNYMSDESAAEAWNQRAEERTGHWNKKNGMYECSECGRVEFKKSKFCPNCGSDMRGEEE